MLRSRSRRGLSRSVVHAAGRAASRPALLEALEARRVLAVDLTLSHVAAPPVTVSGGERIEVSFAFANEGDTGFSGSFHGQMVLSSDQVFGNGDDIVIFDETVEADMPAGKREFSFAELPIETGLPEGEYYVGLRADIDNEVAESDEANNTAFSAGTFTVEHVEVVEGFDLSLDRIVGASFGADGSIYMGAAFTNNGERFDGFYHYEIRLSLDQEWGNGDDVLLGAHETEDHLAAGEARSGAAAFPLPAGIEPGSYYLGAFIDSEDEVEEFDEANNIAWSSEAFEIDESGHGTSTELVDLVVPAVAALQELVAPGQALDVEYVIQSPTGMVQGQHVIEVRLSRDTVWGNEDDIPLLVDQRDVGIGEPGGTTASLRLPRHVPGGTYNVAVLVDSTNLIFEINENNNLAWASAPVEVGFGEEGDPDLSVFAIAPQPGAHAAGDEVFVAFEWGNRGRAAEAPAAYEVRLSLDGEWGNEDDVVLGEGTIQQVGGGHRGFSRDLFALPAGVAPGEYRVGVWIDSEEAIEEGSEDNNRRWSPPGSFIVVDAGQGASGEVGVYRNGRAVADDTQQGEGDPTRYRRVEVGEGYRERVFTFFNYGDQAITVDSIEILGAGAGDFELAGGVSSTIIPGDAATVRVRFTPSQEGARRAVVRIVATINGEQQEVEFIVRGTGNLAEDAPDASVTHRGSEVPSGTLEPVTGEGTLIPETAVGEFRQRLFLIHNDGATALRLTTPGVRLVGADAGEFEVVGLPDELEVGVGESVFFYVRFMPTSAGEKSATVEIVSNDPDEGVYSFVVSGTGTVA